MKTKLAKWLSALLTLCLLSTLVPMAMMEGLDVRYEETESGEIVQPDGNDQSNNLEAPVDDVIILLGNDETINADSTITSETTENSELYYVQVNDDSVPIYSDVDGIDVIGYASHASILLAIGEFESFTHVAFEDGNSITTGYISSDRILILSSEDEDSLLQSMESSNTLKYYDDIHVVPNVQLLTEILSSPFEPLYAADSSLGYFKDEPKASDRIFIYNQGGDGLKETDVQWAWHADVIKENHESTSYPQNSPFRYIYIGAQRKPVATGWGWGCGIYALAHIVQWITGNKMTLENGNDLLMEFINSGLEHKAWPWDDYNYPDVLQKYAIEQTTVPISEGDLKAFFDRGGAIKIGGYGHYTAIVGIAQGSTGEAWMHVVDSSCASTTTRVGSKRAYDFSSGELKSCRYNGDEYWIPYSDFLWVWNTYVWTDDYGVDHHSVWAFQPSIRVESINLNENKIKLNIKKNEQHQLIASIVPSNAVNKNVNWKSLNTNVVTVDANGLITAISTGETDIICSAQDGSGVTATCHVEVINFALNKREIPDAYIGYTDKLVGKIGDKEVKCTFSSDNSNVVKVDKNGKITAKKDGIATITATASSGETDTCKVTVHPKPKSVALNMSNGFCLNAGQTFQMKLEYTPSDALPAGPVTWSSSKQSVARIDEKTGFITALAEGTTNIKCKIKGTSGKTVKLEVVDPNKPAALKLTYDKSFDGKTLDINQDLHLSCAFAPEKATSDIEWKTSSSKIATVTNGVVKPLKEGTVTITATAAKNKKATASIKITIQDKHKPTGMAVSINGKECKKGGTVGVERGDPVKVDVTLTPATATTRYTTTSSKPKVAEAKVTDSGEIYLHCYTEGTTKITISTSVKKVSINFNVKVTDPNKPSEVIIMEKILEGKKEKPREMTIGETLQLNAVVLPLTALSAVTWSVKNPSVVSVTADGFITAKKNGTAKITATSVADKKVSETISIKVSKAPEPTSVYFDKNSIPLTKGQTYQLTLKYNPSNAASTITWTAKGCVSVDKNGLVTAKSTGTGSVTAKTKNKKEATVQFVVEDGNTTPAVIKVNSISLDPSALTLQVGETKTLMSTIAPANATNRSVVWSTSDTSVATIVDAKVTAVAPGTATITCTAQDDSGVSGKCEVTVAEDPLTLDQTGTISMNIGEIFKLKASAHQSGAGKNLRWYASDFKNGGYAVVDKNGTIHAYRGGKVTINVVDSNGNKASVGVTISGEASYEDYKINVLSMINEHRRNNSVYEVPINAQKEAPAQQGAQDVMDDKEVTNGGFWVYMGGGVFAGNWSFEETLSMRLNDKESDVGDSILHECEDGIGIGGVATWTQRCLFIQF